MPMTTDNLTDTKINLRLAEALGVDLTAQTDEERKSMLFDFLRSHIEKITPVYREYRARAFQNDPYRMINLPEYAWECRHGQPWQADIEAHVAAYRRTPPNWANSLELAFELGEEMRKRGLDPFFVSQISKVVLEDLGYINDFEVAHATARQHATAALRTLEEAKSGQ